MKVIKRDARIVDFDRAKIESAIVGAMDDIGVSRYDIAKRISHDIELELKDCDSIDIESIQTIVEDKLMNSSMKDVARQYIRYRYDREKERELKRDLYLRYDDFRTLITGQNDEANKENSNKDTRIIPTMRDYIAGFSCKEMAQKIIIPKDIVDAHQQGIIHFHDMDYSPAMPMTNCCLINLEDMLQNGTVISGTMIEKPHSFRTACTIVTQIITQVASSQYGGNTINLAHIVPFVDISRQKIKNEVKNEIDLLVKNTELNEQNVEDIINKITEKRLHDEIKDGIQTIQYQLITMSTTNGQSPFTSVFMYLDDVEEGQERDDLALIIKEILKQRIEGVKNEQGVPITTAFPKLLYVLDEDNIHEDSKYYYLTKLAAECTAKRLVPDYISAKKMKELKGDTYGCIKYCA